jgi:hypothetical protein
MKILLAHVSHLPHNPCCFQADVVDYYANVVASLYTTQVGTAGTNISYESNCLYTECTIGNWQADKLREVTNTTMAFINSGSIGYTLLLIRLLDSFISS